MSIECLTIALTNRCPLTCAHCGPSSGPHEPQGLDAAAVQRACRAAVRCGAVLVNFTGGEPFATGPLLRASVEFANSAGLLTRVTTGGSWAGSESEALRRLQSIAGVGLKQLCVSWSDGHAGQLTVHNVINCVKAARQLGVMPMVALGVTNTGAVSRSNLERSFAAAVVELPQLFEIPLIPFGRAADHIPAHDILKQALEELDTPCPSIGRRPSILSDGTIASCSVVFAKDCVALHVGHLDRDDVDEVLADLPRRPLTCLIGRLGPVALKQMVDEAMGQGLSRTTYANICHLCGDILNRSGAVDVLRTLEVLPKTPA